MLKLKLKYGECSDFEDIIKVRWKLKSDLLWVPLQLYRGQVLFSGTGCFAFESLVACRLVEWGLIWRYTIYTQRINILRCYYARH